MNCIHCGANTKVSSTRVTSTYGATFRRRRACVADFMHRFSTYEIDGLEVLETKLRAEKMREELAKEQARQLELARRTRAKRMKIINRARRNFAEVSIVWLHAGDWDGPMPKILTIFDLAATGRVCPKPKAL